VAGSLLCCSIYKRMVAPDDPVPDNRMIIRLPDEKQAYSPWLDETDPSRSVYEKFPASVTVRSAKVEISVSNEQDYADKKYGGIGANKPPTLLPTNLGSATKSLNTPTTLLAPSESTSS